MAKRGPARRTDFCSGSGWGITPSVGSKCGATSVRPRDEASGPGPFGITESNRRFSVDRGPLIAQPGKDGTNGHRGYRPRYPGRRRQHESVSRSIAVREYDGPTPVQKVGERAYHNNITIVIIGRFWRPSDTFGYIERSTWTGYVELLADSTIDFSFPVAPGRRPALTSVSADVPIWGEARARRSCSGGGPDLCLESLCSLSQEASRSRTTNLA